MEASSHGFSFSGLLDADDLSEDDILEQALQEDNELSGRGAVSSKGGKKFNPFDWDLDDEEREHNQMESLSSSLFDSKATDLTDAKEFLKKSKFDQNDGKSSEEIVGEAWGGEKYSLKESSVTSRQTHNKPTATVITSARARSGSSGAKSIASVPSFDTNRANSTKKENRGSSGSMVDKGRQATTSLPLQPVQDLNDVLSNEPQISAREYEKVKLELNKCKRAIEVLKNDRWTAIPPQEAVKRLILGKPYSLEYYKSLQEKIQLLDYALKYHDGNAIMAVLLFLRRTLKPGIFATQLKQRPEALNHFIRYLEATSELKSLMDLYKELNRTDDAALLHYHYITKIEKPDLKLREIEKWQRDHKHANGINEMASYIEEERKVLEIQIRMETEDQEAEKQEKNAMLRYHPRTTSIPLKSLLTTLYYCAVYHFDKPTDQFHPSSLKKEFKLTDKQYEWSVLPARAKFHKWADLSEILTTSGWLRRKSERSQIGFEKVTEILHKNGAPAEILEKYIRLVENSEAKLKIATLCKCHDVAIDTIVAMRDKQRLEQYRENVKFDGKFRQRVANLLSDNTIKWR